MPRCCCYLHAHYSETAVDPPPQRALTCNHSIIDHRSKKHKGRCHHVAKCSRVRCLFAYSVTGTIFADHLQWGLVTAYTWLAHATAHTATANEHQCISVISAVPETQDPSNTPNEHMDSDAPPYSFIQQNTRSAHRATTIRIPVSMTATLDGMAHLASNSRLCICMLDVRVCITSGGCTPMLRQATKAAATVLDRSTQRQERLTREAGEAVMAGAADCALPPSCCTALNSAACASL